ncbi:MAG TPA: alkaline phosphatase family protein [Thermoanaerobaculia bacterium]|nr:alkaline phosphatase family protein [Thermoanaerobaculia bacterium]
MLRFRRAQAAPLILITASLALVPLAASPAQPARPRVIVLGFDGVDAAFTERWMDEGKLPNLARLRTGGTFRPLRPTLPAQTPVSWSTFSTGIDPGRTGIFDFLRRDPKTYMPVFAAFDETTEPFLFGANNPAAFGAAGFLLSFVLLFGGLKLARRPLRASVIGGLVAGVAVGAVGWVAADRLLPETRPGVVNRRQGIPMWDVVARAGLKAKVVQVPVTFPATDFEHGHMLSGLGVPDLSGRIGKPFYFTSELDLKMTGSNEFSIEVVQLEDNRGVIRTEVVGPPNKLFEDPPYVAQPMTITVAEDRESIEIELGDQNLRLEPGEWTEWVDFTFEFNWLIRLGGISRFHLISVQPEVRLYLSPINFDPRDLPPGLRISTPPDWAEELAREYGRFKTMGWAIDTWAISEGFANEQMFWDDMEWTVQQFRTMFRAFLEEGDDLLIQQFEFPDRVGHVFWRFVDPEHPAHDAELAARWGEGLLLTYQLMDAIVGEAMEAAQASGAALIVVSDHGFATWRKSINYNTWLVQNGYLGLRSGVETGERTLEILFDSGQFWENVDWSKTRAYALGLGPIYINVRGREAQGTVEPGAEYDALKLEIAAGLEALVDPENGQTPVSRVVPREQAYRQFDPNVIPDLFVTNNPGYRVSWQTSLGGVQKDLFTVNDRVWSGDHCSLDPEKVKGIFFYDRKLETDRAPYIADIYATVLDLLRVEPPYELDGVALK